MNRGSQMREVASWWISVVAASVFIAVPLQGQGPGVQAPTPARLSPPNGTASVQFTRVTAVRELSDGSLLVNDAGEQRLSLIDFDAGTAVVVGGKGEGPGEYVQPVGLFPLGGDSTVLTDGHNGRWTLYRRSTFLSTIAKPPSDRLWLGSILGFDRSGRLLSQQGLSFRGRFPVPTAADSLVLIAVSADGEKQDTVGGLRGAGAAAHIRPPAPGRDGLVLTNPLAAQDQALMFTDGWIAVARLAPYRVDWRRPDGEWQMGLPLPFAEVRLRAEDRCDIWEAVWPGASFECDPEFVPEWPDVVPPFLVGTGTDRTPVLLATAEGRLLIRRTAVAGPAAGQYDLVDRAGELVGSIAVPPQMRILGLGAGTVYAVSMDEWGLQTLTRHPWEERDHD